MELSHIIYQAVQCTYAWKSSNNYKVGSFQILIRLVRSDVFELFVICFHEFLKMDLLFLNLIFWVKKWLDFFHFDNFMGLWNQVMNTSIISRGKIAQHFKMGWNHFWGSSSIALRYKSHRISHWNPMHYRFSFRIFLNP